MSLAAATSSQLLRPSSLGCGAPQRQPRLGATPQLLPQQRRAGRLVPRTAEPAAPAQPADTRSAAELVDFVLGKIEGTGGCASCAQRRAAAKERLVKGRAGRAGRHVRRFRRSTPAATTWPLLLLALQPRTPHCFRL